MDRADLFRLVDRALAHADGEAWLTGVLDIHSADVAVLVVDMAGFTRTTRDRSLAAALMAIRRLQLAVITAVERHGGQVVKFVADNAFCTFPDVARAQAAAREIVAAQPSGAGIGHGRVLLLADDLYGDPVNQASKLGEDMAMPGQVLLTAAAGATLPPSDQ